MNKAKCWGFSKALLILGVLRVILLAAGVTAIASQPEQADKDTTHLDLARFDKFLDQHQDVRKQLFKDPSLVNNSKYLEAHSDLSDFFKRNPGIQKEISENPQDFMKWEARYERSGGDITHFDVERLDKFLDQNPAIAQELYKKPSLIQDANYIEHRSALKTFLVQNPVIHKQLKEDPQRFIDLEKRWEKYGNKEDKQ